MKVVIGSFICLSLLAACAAEGNKHLSDCVNPFIGASTSTELAGSYHGLGKTYPGATTPFGVVQVSPQTITGGDHASGYSDEHRTIEGFAFTQMSGVGWYGDLGNLLTMPTNGPLRLVAGREDGSVQGGYRSSYDKKTEKASAGYYSVVLTDYGIRAEATAAPHSGMLRFTFPAHEQSRIQLDLARRVGGTSVEQYAAVKDEHTLCGWMKCTPEGGGWGDGWGQANYTVYFYAVFSKPLKQFGFWSADIPNDWGRRNGDVASPSYQQQVAKAMVMRQKTEQTGKHIGFFTEFATTADEEVTVQVGISFVDMVGAENNYRREIAGKSFEQVREKAVAAWDRQLAQMEVQGGTEEQRTVFYTALYHTMLDPRVIADIDGRYRGGDGAIHRTEKFARRTIFSGWDVFRSQFPLQTLINPGMVNDEINSLISLAEENGREYYDRWEFLNAYSGCMIGNPALSVLADAYLKGIRGYDIEKAYRYACNTAERFGNGERGYSVMSVSGTLEYSYFDWCLAQLAKAIGHEDDAQRYEQRGKNYRNTFNPEVGWFCPRQEDGTFALWDKDARLRYAFGCEESNLYQQGWFVPHDVDGMVRLMGGREKVLEELMAFFEQTPDDVSWNDYYNHANEPVHLVPFLFNRLGVPWLTQKWTRHICEKAYRNAVEGMVGNEDVGQMSAWYVLAASGLHPSCPGTTRYEITSPLFDEIRIRLDDDYFTGGEFIIKALNNSKENRYIQKVFLNGQEYRKCYIDFRDLTSGGVLELTMGDTPTQFFTEY